MLADPMSTYLSLISIPSPASEGATSMRKYGVPFGHQQS